MVSVRCRYLAAAMLAASVGTAPAASGQAGGIQLSPTRLVLEAGARSTTLTVENGLDRAVTFQTRTFAWTNTPDAAVKLTPTEDLVVFPATLQLQPGDSRRIRIGGPMVPADVERAYRLILDEVATPVGSGAPIQLNTRLQFSLPVFQLPGRATMRVDLSAPSVGPGGVAVRLANAGSVHLTPETIVLEGVAADGTVAWTKRFSAWYLLAGEVRDLAVPWSEVDCAAATTLRAEAAFAESPTLRVREVLSLPSGACGGR